MFSFIHTYTEDSFEGLIKNGLLRRGDGLKLMHKPYMPVPYDFNHIAAVGGDLYNRLSDLRCPFYIDRLQGGIGLPYHYGYSPEIVRAYKELLGDGFWGWQMHEWASNLRSDRNRIREKYSALGIDDDDKRRVFWEKVISGKEDLFLEAMSPLEWSVYPLPADRMELLEAMYRLYAKRSESTGNMLIPADSYYMAPSIEIKHGAKLLLPEVGWQIGGMRRQLAYNRGMAQAAGIRWGIYYECWCYNSACGSLTIPFSLREGQDEWIEDQFHTGSGNDRSPEEREKGGTSRNLQARAWRFAYLSGACAIGEEYGVCNTFRSLNDFELSEYGITKKEFLRFTEKLPDAGRPFRPAVIALPSSENMPVLETDISDDYLECPVSDQSFPAPAGRTGKIRSVMNGVFGVKGRFGNNSHVMTNGGLPELFDIVNADSLTDKSGYGYVVDLSFGDLPSSIPGKRIAPDELMPLLSSELPCVIDGNAHIMYNRIDGGWIVSMFNNDGISCDAFEGDRQLHEADISFDMTLNGDRSVEIIDGGGSLSRDGMICHIELEAGQWLIIRLGQ